LGDRLPSSYTACATRIMVTVAAMTLVAQNCRVARLQKRRNLTPYLCVRECVHAFSYACVCVTVQGRVSTSGPCARGCVHKRPLATASGRVGQPKEWDAGIPEASPPSSPNTTTPNYIQGMHYAPFNEGSPACSTTHSKRGRQHVHV